MVMWRRRDFVESEIRRMRELLQRHKRVRIEVSRRGLGFRVIGKKGFGVLGNGCCFPVRGRMRMMRL